MCQSGKKYNQYHQQIDGGAIFLFRKFVCFYHKTRHLHCKIPVNFCLCFRNWYLAMSHFSQMPKKSALQSSWCHASWLCPWFLDLSLFSLNWWLFYQNSSMILMIRWLYRGLGIKRTLIQPIRLIHTWKKHVVAVWEKSPTFLADLNLRLN